MTPPSPARRALLALPAVAFALGVLYLSTRSPEHLPDTGVAGGDKALHVLEYALLGVLLLLPVWDLAWRGRAAALAVGAPFALLDEIVQSTVPGRFGDVGDLAMDLVGLALAVLAHVLLTRAKGERAPTGGERT